MSGINPKDQFTWLLEVGPAIIGAAVMAKTYTTFHLTPLVYILILIHSIVLMIGGHYTYAEVPFFDYLKDVFNFTRNNYDKAGHFVQGFVPVLISREIIIRKNVIPDAVRRNFFILYFCLGFSAFYELIEWGVALASGKDAVAFLGTQGYIWDTQSEMGLALQGAIIGLMSLSKLYNKQLLNLNNSY